MRTRSLNMIWLTAVLLVAGPVVSGAQETSVDTLDGLPSHSYPVSGTVMDLVRNPEDLAVLRIALRKAITTDLAESDIGDASTLQMLHKCLFRLDLLDRNYAAALDHLDRMQSLETKNTSRLMAGLIPRAIIAAGTGLKSESDEDSFRAAFREHLEESLAELPWAAIKDQAKEMKATAEYLSKDLLLGLVEARFQPSVAATGALNLDLAVRLVHLVYLYEIELPVNPVIADVLGRFIVQNEEPMIDIWASRELVLPAEDTLETVVIGIWDAGVDTTVFPGLMWTNTEEHANGRDDDGNGYIDDLNGIAFDLEGNISRELLLPLGQQADQTETVFEFMQGFWDLISAIDSPAATAARKKISTLPASDVGAFMNSVSLATHYLHGTHVAGIAVAGNPQARILVVRATFDHLEPPRPLSIAWAHKYARSFERSIAYFAAQGVKVVNMSWGFDFGMIEAGLTAGGVGESPEERTRLAREILQIMGDGLKNAMADTPQILYVTSAGNEDGDVEFDLVIPSSFDLPNLIVVGAVDLAGNPTSFTSFGRNVKVYANGYQVDSYVPGGERMKGSGTSMAAPAVANLAAKIMSKDPTLTPAEVVDLIERGANKHIENPGILLLNPKVSWELLEEGPKG